MAGRASGCWVTSGDVLLIRLSQNLSEEEVRTALAQTVDQLPIEARFTPSLPAIDWLYYFRRSFAGVSREKYIDQLCRLLYALERDDLVGRLVAPYTGSRLRSMGEGKFVDHEEEAQVLRLEAGESTPLSRLFDQLKLVVPEPCVRVMVRTSPLPPATQKQIIECGCDLRLFLNYMLDRRYLSGGNLECLSIWLEELGLMDGLRLLQQYWAVHTSLRGSGRATSVPSPPSSSANSSQFGILTSASIRTIAGITQPAKRPAERQVSEEVLWPPSAKRLDQSPPSQSRLSEDEAPMDVDKLNSQTVERGGAFGNHATVGSTTRSVASKNTLPAASSLQSGAGELPGSTQRTTGPHHSEAWSPRQPSEDRKTDTRGRPGTTAPPPSGSGKPHVNAVRPAGDHQRRRSPASGHNTSINSSSNARHHEGHRVLSPPHTPSDSSAIRPSNSVREFGKRMGDGGHTTPRVSQSNREDSLLLGPPLSGHTNRSKNSPSVSNRKQSSAASRILAALEPSTAQAKEHPVSPKETEKNETQGSLHARLEELRASVQGEISAATPKYVSMQADEVWTSTMAEEKVDTGESNSNLESKTSDKRRMDQKKTKRTANTKQTESDELAKKDKSLVSQREDSHKDTSHRHDQAHHNKQEDKHSRAPHPHNTRTLHNAAAGLSSLVSDLMLYPALGQKPPQASVDVEKCLESTHVKPASSMHVKPSTGIASASSSTNTKLQLHPAQIKQEPAEDLSSYGAGAALVAASSSGKSASSRQETDSSDDDDDEFFSATESPDEVEGNSGRTLRSSSSKGAPRRKSKRRIAAKGKKRKKPTSTNIVGKVKKLEGNLESVYLHTMSGRNTEASAPPVDAEAVSGSSEHEDRSRICIVCLVAERRIALQPCQHVVLCAGCAERCRLCPICSKQITGRQEIILA